MGSDVCEACGCDVSAYDEKVNEASGLPESWFKRTIDGRNYALCDCCGHFRQFRGGMSPYLQSALGLDDDARCEDLGEVSEMAAIRAERRKARRRGA